jgi:hypothetical protein
VVGSIGATVKEGDHVKRGDELGWFAFGEQKLLSCDDYDVNWLQSRHKGGSTIVCLFEKGKLRWDEDILDNSSQAIETLVRMGMGVGKAVGDDMWPGFTLIIHNDLNDIDFSMIYIQYKEAGWERHTLES